MKKAISTLAHALLRAMYENAADFTLTFRRLCDAAADEKADADVRASFANPAAYDSWVARWRSRLAAEELESNARARAMRSANPAFIPRNHRVGQALDAAIRVRRLFTVCRAADGSLATL